MHHLPVPLGQAWVRALGPEPEPGPVQALEPEPVQALGLGPEQALGPGPEQVPGPVPVQALEPEPGPEQVPGPKSVSGSVQPAIPQESERQTG